MEENTDKKPSLFRETVEAVIISLIIVLPIRYFIVQPFFVKGSSMEPNFKDGQYLLIDELSYRFGDPKRGDTIVFKYPLDPSQYYIKRIIGLPGERIKIENNTITVFSHPGLSGQKISEAYIPQSTATYGNSDVSLNNKEYFVLGDNRLASFDSRRWGPLPKNNIIGKVYLRAWPIASAQVIPTPAYQ